MARRHVSNQVRTPRRRSEWGLGPGGSAITQLTGTGSVFLGSGIVSSTLPITVVRIRGELLLFLSSATAALDGYTGAFGIGRVATSAFSAGITAVPTPVAEQSWEGWLYHRYFSITAATPMDGQAATDTDVLNNVTAALRIEVDTKAMRKLEEDEQTIYAALEAVEVGGATLKMFFDSRMLALMP